MSSAQPDWPSPRRTLPAAATIARIDATIALNSFFVGSRKTLYVAPVYAPLMFGGCRHARRVNMRRQSHTISSEGQVSDAAAVCRQLADTCFSGSVNRSCRHQCAPFPSHEPTTYARWSSLHEYTLSIQTMRCGFKAGRGVVTAADLLDHHIQRCHPVQQILQLHQCARHSLNTVHWAYPG